MSIDKTEYRRFIENIGKDYFFYRHDAAGVMTYVSPSIFEMLGYSPQDYRIHYSKYMTTNPANEAVARFTGLGLNGERQAPYEVEVSHKDGSARWVEVSVKKPSVLSGDGLVAVTIRRERA